MMVMPGWAASPCSGPTHADDALVGVAHGVAGDPELQAVGGQHGQLLGRNGIGHRLVDARRRHVVVGGGDGEVGSVDPRPASRSPSKAWVRPPRGSGAWVPRRPHRARRRRRRGPHGGPTPSRTACAGVSVIGSGPYGDDLDPGGYPRGAAYCTVSRRPSARAGPGPVATPARPRSGPPGSPRSSRRRSRRSRPGHRPRSRSVTHGARGHRGRPNPGLASTTVAVFNSRWSWRIWDFHLALCCSLAAVVVAVLGQGRLMPGPYSMAVVISTRPRVVRSSSSACNWS